jgi:hypothetical protein
LVSEELKTGFKASLDGYKLKELLPSQLLEACGEVLSSEQFSLPAKQFLDTYYDKGFFPDYLQVVSKGQSDYDVEESKDNISRVFEILDQRFHEFSQK